MTTQINIRSLFKIDAAFEAMLGLVLGVGAAVGWLTGSDLLVSRGIVIGAGAALLIASASVMRYFIRAPGRVLLELAVGNAALAAAGLSWLVADQGFSSAGTTILVIVVVWKFGISSLQMGSTRKRSGIRRVDAD